MGLIDRLRARTAAMDEAAGLSKKASGATAAKKKHKKVKRTKVSQFSNEELAKMPNSEYMKLEFDR